MKTRALERFLEWKGWSYDELYKRYFDASRSGDPRDLALMNTGLVLWYKELRKRARAVKKLKKPHS